MAIDADLNAGQITDDQARERRLKIQHEADFYGAMDGASKFVRGDAIAGVIIVAVNLLAGITVGVVQQGMEFSEALSTFTLLTVGDGLAAQIPALLISTATGIVVTRAAGENDLGHDIAGQLLARSRPLFICGGVLIGLGLVPGLPHIPFLLIGGALVTVGVFVRNQHRDENAFAVEEDRRQLEAAKPMAGSPESVRSALALDTLELEIGYGLISLVDESEGGELLTRVSLVRRQMAQDLGLVLAPIRIRDNVQLGSHAYAVKIRGAEIARGELLPGSLLAMNPGDADPSLDGVATTEPAFGLPALWISQAARERAEAAGYTVVDPASIIITHLTEVVRQHAGELISLQDVKLLVDGLRERMPAVVDEATPELLSLGEVHRVLAALLAEGVSIRDLATILEMLSDKARITKDTALLAEYARQALARQITQEMLGPGGELSVITLDAGFEHEVTESIVQTPDGTYLGLDPGRAAAMCDGVRIQVEQAAKLGVRPALLCSARLRRHLKALTSHAVPRLVVLSYNEITPSVRVETVGVVHAEAAVAA
jgi:flagellar biosynthesis protein FlhA